MNIQSIRQWLNRFTLLLFTSLPAAAQAASVEDILNNAHGYLSGAVARSAGIVAIVVTGYLCIAQQRMPKQTFLMILVGFGLIFGADSLYSTLMGD